MSNKNRFIHISQFDIIIIINNDISQQKTLMLHIQQKVYHQNNLLFVFVLQSAHYTLMRFSQNF